MSESLRDELVRLDAEIEVLESRKRDIYKRSLSAPEEQKICPNFVAEMLAEEDPWPAMKWPVNVAGIEWGDGEVLRAPLLGAGVTWVAIRPCGDEHGGRTFLGFLLGDLALSASARFDRESGVMSITYGSHNPAIWVPDLGRIVYGCESWWGAIKSADDMKQIANADIDNVWYVRALKDLATTGDKPCP